MASLNCHSIRAEDKALLLSRRMQEHDVDVACLQETWLGHDSTWHLDHTWDHVIYRPAAQDQWQGRGVAIIARRAPLAARGWHLRPAGQHTAPTFQAVAARLGPLMIVSVYVYVRGPRDGVWEDLGDVVRAWQAGDEMPTIIAGDFNPHHQARPDVLHQHRAAIDAYPLIQGVTHNGGRQLDQIYVNELLRAGALGQPPVFCPGISDHALLLGTITVAAADPPPPAPPPPERINFKRLSRMMAADLAEDIEDLPRRPPTMRTANDALLQTAARRLGHLRPRRQRRDPAWSNPAVRAAYHDLTQLERQATSARDAECASLRCALTQAKKRFRRALDDARYIAHVDKLLKLANKTLDFIFHMYRKGRRYPRTLAQIDPKRAAQHLRRVFTPERPFAEPAVLTNCTITWTIHPDEVERAIVHSRSSAPGPDGLDIRFLKHVRESAKYYLPPVFTNAIRRGDSTLNEGETLMFAKTFDAQADAGKYRPITLLPWLQRLLASVVDQRLRGEAVNNPTVRANFSQSQAGFMPHRSTHEQALVLQLLQADARMRKAPLYAILLDISQAFDSLDHGHLLQIMLDTGFAHESVAVVRNLLRDGTTKMGTELIRFLRGAPQGSPSSPFLSLLYFNSLAQDIKAYVIQHIKDAPRLFGVQPEEHEAELFTLLLFADDTTLLGATPKFLRGLLKVVSGWGFRYGIKFNAAKSFIAQLSRPLSMAATEPYPKWARDLHVQRHAIPAADGASPVKLVGVPFHLALEKQPTYRAHAVNLSKARGALKALAGVFAPPRGRGGRARPAAVLHFHTLRIGIVQTVIPAALYGAPVVPLKTAELDVEIRKTLRQILGLPSNFSTGLLHWLLRLWPCELTADFMVLKEAWKLRHQYWIGKYIARATPAHLHRHETDPGPYRYMTEILKKYDLSWNIVCKPPYAPKPRPEPESTPGPAASQRDRPLPAGEKPAPYKHWVALCRERINLRFARWLMDKKDGYPASNPWRAVFPRDLTSALETVKKGELPDVLISGDVGRAALRMWAPQLSQLPRGGGASTCKWCQQPASETGFHLLRCQAQPPRAQRLVTRALELVRRDMSQAGRPVDPRQQLDPERLYYATWPGQDPQSLRQCLLCVSRAIDEYSKTAQPRHAEGLPETYDLVLPVHARLP
jgi:hypothetical protein